MFRYREYTPYDARYEFQKHRPILRNLAARKFRLESVTWLYRGVNKRNGNRGHRRWARGRPGRLIAAKIRAFISVRY